MHQETLHAEQKYRGDVATNYDEKRAKQEKRKAEFKILEKWLSELPAGTHVLDCPVGTGWLFPIYDKHAFHVLGLDINEDMLKEARKKITSERIKVRHGNILAIDRPPKCVDVALAIRLFNYLAPEDVKKALRELQRVARMKVMFTMRVAGSPRARPMSLVMESLLPHWTLSRTAQIEPNYLMFMLERK